MAKTTTAYDKMVDEIIATVGEDALPDVASHGADTGWTGFSYYEDTVKFFEKHRDAIFEMLGEDADDQGVSVPELIASFRVAKENGMDTYEGFANGLAWYALEEVARDETEGDDDEEGDGEGDKE